MHSDVSGVAKSWKIPVFSSRSAIFHVVLVGFSLCVVPGLHAQEAPTVAIHLDPAATTIRWTLDSLLHKEHGTFKLKGGDVVVNAQTGLAQGEILVDATTGASGNSARDSKWQKEVLDSATYPAIIFHPTKLDGLKGIDGTQQVQASGMMTLHGKDHPLTTTLTVQVQGKDVTVTGHFTVPYVEWGLKQASAGLIRYDKQIAIDISAKGEVAREKAKASPDYQ